VLRDKRFVTYVLTLTGYYMLAVQVMLMLPIMVNDIRRFAGGGQMDVRH
jgi:DHA1 family multidrug resistance protein-like MFS transporter